MGTAVISTRGDASFCADITLLAALKPKPSRRLPSGAALLQGEGCKPDGCRAGGRRRDAWGERGLGGMRKQQASLLSSGHSGVPRPRRRRCPTDGPRFAGASRCWEACCLQHARAGRLPSCSALPQRPRKEVVAFLREEKGSGAASAGQPATLSAHCALPGLGCSCRLPRVHELPCPALPGKEWESGLWGVQLPAAKSWEGAKARWDGVWDGGGLTARGFVAVFGVLISTPGCYSRGPEAEELQAMPRAVVPRSWSCGPSPRGIALYEEEVRAAPCS